MSSSLFSNRQLLVASMHQKERAIAPILEKHLGVKCVLYDGLNTDLLGTFTGEIERKLDPVSTVREKCLMAMKLSGCDLAVASEGSFGPHPALYFLHANEEWLMLIDQKNHLEILAREITTQTNFDAKTVFNETELLEFAQSKGFPSHALILRKTPTSLSPIVKGIHHSPQLLSEFAKLNADKSGVYVETDMRAMHNPSRMKTIEAATQKLLQMLQSNCPNCHIPGFWITETLKGLPCAGCGHPTQSVKAHVYRCSHCQFEKTQSLIDQKPNEDPMYCDYCNP